MYYLGLKSELKEIETQGLMGKRILTSDYNKNFKENEIVLEIDISELTEVEKDTYTDIPKSAVIGIKSRS